jgi:DHA1 family multidrug resistance protein-like MFS transporter
LMATPLISPFVARELGGDAALAGVLVGLGPLASLVSKVPISIHVSTRDIGSWLLLSLALNSVSLFGYYASPDYLVFSVFRLLNGVALALELTTMLTLSGLSARSDAELASSVQRYTAATAMGLALGPLLGTLPVALVGIRGTFAVAGTIASVALLPAAIHQRMTRGLWVGFSAGRLNTNDLIHLLTIEPFKLGTLTYLSFAFFSGVLFAYGPLIILLEVGLPEYWVTLMFFVFFITSTAVRFLLPKILSRSTPYSLLSFSLVAASTALVLLGLIRSPPLLPLGFILGGMGHGIIFPLTAIIVFKAVPPAQKFASNAIYLTAFDLGQLLGPTLSSTLVLGLGIPRTMIVTALVPALGLIAVSRLPRAW